MFQKFIYNLIQSIKHLYERLDMAYEQTYTDNVISYKLSKERIKRRKENKKRVIAIMKDFVKKQYREAEHDEMPEYVAEGLALNLYAIAQAKGDIDEFGNFVGELGSFDD